MSETVTNPSTEIAIREVAAVERALLTGILPDQVEDPEIVQRAIMARILSQDSVEGILDTGSGLDSWGDLEGVPVSVLDVRFNVSTFEEGPPVYAVVDVVVLKGKQEGERLLVSCGGTNVMAQLVALVKAGALPLDVKLTRTTKETRQGYRPLWLQAA